MFEPSFLRSSTAQMPVVDSPTLEEHVHGLWKDVANIEQADLAPQLAVETSIIEFGKIGFVFSSLPGS